MTEIEIYQTPDKQIEVQVRLENETVWLSQKQMAALFETTPQNITLHLKKIFTEKEIDEKSTCKQYLQVQMEGKREIKE